MRAEAERDSLGELGRGATVELRTERETWELGRSIGSSLAAPEAAFPEWRPGWRKTPAILLLRGDMGVGKTVLVAGLATGLGLEPGAVQSPTFTLINEYRDAEGGVCLVHCDLYRLQPGEVEGTGLLETLDQSPAGAVVVEWSERLPYPLRDAVTLQLSRVVDAPSRRRIQVVAS